MPSKPPGAPSTSSTVELHVERCGPRGAVAVVGLAGEFDIETVPLIDGFLRRVFGPFYHRHHVLLDLAGVTLVDSSFVSFLVGLVSRARGEGKDVVLARPSGQVRRTLLLVGLPNLVPVYESLEEAVAVVASGQVPLIPPVYPSRAPVGG